MTIDPQEHVVFLGSLADDLVGLPHAEQIRDAAECIIDTTTERDELLAALVALVEEKQPLGIERESYQTALALVIKYYDNVDSPEEWAARKAAA